MDSSITHLVLRKKIVQRDWKLAIPDRGRNNGRKHLVKQIWPSKEKPIDMPEWEAGPEDGKTPVLETGEGGTEIATFTEEAGQDRHKHVVSTEIYTVLTGRLKMLVNDQGPIELGIGDEVVILPGTVHEIIQDVTTRIEARSVEEEPTLLVRVHALNCHGDTDKYVQLQPDGPWLQWSSLSSDEKRAAYKKQGNRG